MCGRISSTASAGNSFSTCGGLGPGHQSVATILRVERAEDFGQPAAVAAEADDADAGAVQIARRAANEFAFLLGPEVGGEAAQQGGREGDCVVGHLVGEDARGARDDDVRVDDGWDQDMVEPGGGRLNPEQTLAAADVFPGDGDLRMAAENVGV